jgi:hypothetical protein
MHCSKVLREFPSRLKEKDKELFNEARWEMDQNWRWYRQANLLVDEFYLRKLTPLTFKNFSFLNVL